VRRPSTVELGEIMDGQAGCAKGLLVH
jgi:hypothetical protein